MSRKTKQGIALFHKLATWLWGERLTVVDPVFGSLVTERIRGRGRPFGDPPIFAWATALDPPSGSRCRRINEVIISAGREGPTEEQRSQWQNWVDNYAEFESALKAELYEYYLQWRAIAEESKSQSSNGPALPVPFPQFASAEEALASPTFDDWTLHIDDDESMRFRLNNEWDLEHGLTIVVADGKFIRLVDE